MHYKLPTITIITVTYNCKEKLYNTINSISKQSYSKIEYIIIDGNSTDHTVSLIQENKQYISKWISEPDKGIYDAMNKGLKLAGGDYVWFINAGDEINEPNTIKKMISLNPNADVYYGDTMIINAQGKEIGLRRLKTRKPLTWKSFNMGQVVSHQSFIAKRNLCSFFNLNYKHAADIDWQIKILKKSNKIIDTKIILCRFLDGGKSKQNILPALRERFKIMIHNYGLLRTLFNHILISIKFFLFVIRNRRF